MSRPVDLSKYVEGEPCRKCGNTLYYRKAVCVECERRANARRYAERVGKTYVEPAPLPRMSPYKLAMAMGGYQRSPSALQRSAYLDALTRARFAVLLGNNNPAPEATAPRTAGDLWRSMLPRGVPVKTITERTMLARRTAELAPLVEAVERVFNRLPDLVTATDVHDMLDPALAEKFKMRWPRSVAATLRRLGGVPHDAGQAKLGTARTIYILRRHEHYAALKRSPLLAAYQAIKADKRPLTTTRPPAVRGKASRGRNRRGSGRRPEGRSATAARAMRGYATGSGQKAAKCHNI
jgi:hypothetical protein